MERKPRGYCLIINNERFYDEHGAERPDLRRYGTDMDASRLTNLFEKLHFVVDVHVDLREAEMLEVVAEFAKRCDSHAAELDAIALILLSHGTDGYVYGVDCENRINVWIHYFLLFYFSVVMKMLKISLKSLFYRIFNCFKPKFGIPKFVLIFLM